MGLFLVKGPIRTWIIVATLLSITLAWGRNFMGLTDFFFDYIPGYNKFRTVSMILVIAEFTIPLLGIFALRNIVNKTVSKEQVLKALKYSTGILAGIIVIFLINPGILNFHTGEESQMFMRMFGIKPGQDDQIVNQLVNALVNDRESIMRADAIRSLIFVIIGAGLIWLYIKEKLSAKYLYIIIAIAIVVDLWQVDKRYMNDGHFVSKRKAEVPFTPTDADNMILQDKSPDYRVLNLAVSTFNDASTSYFHKSIGGYHGAKMKRYQELIEHNISPEISRFFKVLRNQPTQQSVDNVMSNLQVINMLNTKYLIINPKSQPILNNFRNGNAWFVNDVKIVNNADEEIAALNKFNSRTTAIVDKRFENLVSKFSKDASAQIQIKSYKPNELVYTSKSNSNQLAVFSEMYYKNGWNAYIDGNLTPHFRANYVLRAMEIPKGEHEIIFKFEPNETMLVAISSISSILLILIVFGVLYLEITKSKILSKFE
jgi:hypothetical protein